MPIPAKSKTNQYTLVDVDYGDTPDDGDGDPLTNPTGSFPTLRYSDGARHVSEHGPWMSTASTATDWEDDGQIDAAGTATGDDIDGGADEDGVELLDLLDPTTTTTELVPGEWATIQVTLDPSLAENAFFYGWIDFTGDGDWDDAGTDTDTGNDSQNWYEQVITAEELTPGVNKISFFVPHTVVTPGTVNARFRLISAQEQTIRDIGGAGWELSYDGIAYSGEVEDYQYTLLDVDYGDAPDDGDGDPLTNPTGSFSTLRYSDGARHVSAYGPFLGTAVDWEGDGQLDDNAAGTTPDDEDGVQLIDVLGTVTTELIPGEWATVEVTLDAAATENGYLYAWIDYNADGVWDNADQTDSDTGNANQFWSERIFSAEELTPGVNTLTFFVPHTGIAPGTVNARFRVVSASEHDYRTDFFTGDPSWALDSDGIAYSGEVEDYQYTLLDVDYGDTPDDGNPFTQPSFPTMRISDGARHVSAAGPWMSTTNTLTDWEDDGQIDGSGTALGDDTDGGADEDGVELLDVYDAYTYLIPGEWAQIRVTVDPALVGNAYFYGWIDFTRDGDWTIPAPIPIPASTIAHGANRSSPQNP